MQGLEVESQRDENSLGLGSYRGPPLGCLPSLLSDFSDLSFISIHSESRVTNCPELFGMRKVPQDVGLFSVKISNDLDKPGIFAFRFFVLHHFTKMILDNLPINTGLIFFHVKVTHGSYGN